jgi:recombination protein RecA
MLKASELEKVEVIVTGTFLDKCTGIGGIPRGRITEIFGDEGMGKSSICLQMVAAAQKQGLKCLWVDVEYSYEAGYAASLGVDNSKLSVLRQEYAEATLEELDGCMDEGWDLIIFDSIGGLTPRAEIEKGAEGKVIGAQAGIVARFCRRMVPALATKNIAMIVINHAFVDLMSGKIMSSGGKKLAFHKSIAIRLKNKMGAVLKQGDRKVGRVVVAEVKKNKLAATEGLEVEGHLLFGEGFSGQADVIDSAIERGVITKTGNSYFFAAKKLGVGLAKVREALKDPVLLEEIKAALV